MTSRMRLQPVPPEQLSPPQRELYDDVVENIVKTLDDKKSFITRDERGALLGPWNAWIHEPVVGGAMWHLSKVMFRSAKLPETLRQVAILTVGSHYRAAYEVYAHSGLSRHYFSQEQVAALASGEAPRDLSPDEMLVYRISKALVVGGPLPDDLYAKGVEVLGQSLLTELIFLVSLYALVSVNLNGFNVPVPAEGL
ncbi:uncharacterized protein Z520_06229 [Fonsecaea multimorphosa CBS 102226]|uniref:Carboxymuconolactone decarboxylase-like domain-containing protein n=1 Tax=Fonsecaea multimorphosa CBS 102226 TaxID=1442371 RepID=A0A0D2K4Q4_9EURO|nr:uncharacterized protein Z520_06229 [Fonsecaea multimorphosa CBS 102226]KIX98149.1 hypothetical protein Z520_06229 [Fonsecaea multimorphosa CBS 102226]OAL24224.1 hypothetical protein AYO22_05884 [Fonsecaea multimorphosa]